MIEYNSTTDQASAIQAVIDAASDGDVIQLESGFLKVETQINVNKEITILGNYATEFRTTSDIHILHTSGANIKIGQIKFTGNSTSMGYGSKTDQFGIYTDTINLCSNLRIFGITGDHLNGGLINAEKTHKGSRNGVYINDSWCTDCNISFLMGEYVSLNNCQSVRHQKGVVIIGGNAQVIGGNFSKGEIGIYIDSPVNGGHGQIVGVTSNHNTTANLDINQITSTLGMTISACQMWTGLIKIRNANNVLFSGNGINTTEFTVDGCKIIMSGNAMHFTPEETLLNSAVIKKSENYKSTTVLW